MVYLNSDGQQFHQYIYKTKNNFSHNTIKLKEEHDCVGNSGHGLGPLQHWGGIKPVNAIQPFPSDNWIANDNTECCV